MIPKFHCSACGMCCSRISGRISGEDKEFLEDYGYGKMPVVRLIKADEMSFPLWDFEAKHFRDYGRKVNIDAKIKPLNGIMDLNSKKFIVIDYYMNSEFCPFLSRDNKCVIYNERRAFVCLLFPFNKTQFLDTGKKDFLFGKCPNIRDILEKITEELNDADEKELIRELYDSFGENFLASVQHDYVTEWSNKTVIELMKSKIIRPAINYPYDFLMRRIDNSEKIDFMDFLVKSEYRSEDEIKELIRRFETLEDARERITKVMSRDIKHTPL